MRARSTAEIAFLVMRALANARLLWVRDGALPLDALPALIPVSAAAIARAIDRLGEEGIVEVSHPAATVRLTERAAREICGGIDPEAPAAQRVGGP